MRMNCYHSKDVECGLIKSRFRLIVIIGCGKIANDVLCHVAKLRPMYGYQLKFIEHELNGFSRLQNLCKEMGVSHAHIADKNSITQLLLELEEPALIISAGNHYIFPYTVTEKQNIEIINFHNALLPKFPGRNAPTWAIYFGESMSGATWHYVNAKIDNGSIIAQKQTSLTGDMKAYELTREIMELAFEAFQNFFELLLKQHIEGYPQPESHIPRKIYYSYEIPSNGICSLDTPADEIYKLLRAMDYGNNRIFPPVQMALEIGKVQIYRYAKRSLKYCTRQNYFVHDLDGQCIYLWLDDESELKIKYKR